MNKITRWLKPSIHLSFFLKMATAITFSIVLVMTSFACLGTSIRATKSLAPESFFSGEQLMIYRSALRDETENLRLSVTAGRTDLNRPGKEDMTLLGLAVLNSERTAIISLMRAGADPNQVIPNAGSPAILAISKHANPPRIDALQALLDGGYDPNQRLEHGKPYLFYFVDMNHWSGLKLAIERGGDINARYPEGTSLLAYLIEGGDFEQARLLISSGADVSIKGKLGESALRAVESKLRKANSSTGANWIELLDLRQEILKRLRNPEDRQTVFTKEVELKIKGD